MIDHSLKTLARSIAREDFSAWMEMHMIDRISGKRVSNNWHHRQWCELAANPEIKRLCVVAPREHAKSEIFSVGYTCWLLDCHPGKYIQIFSNTYGLAKELLLRIKTVAEREFPERLANAPKWTEEEIRLRDGSRVVVKSEGMNVRGPHPDVMICDDILNRLNTMTDYQRKKLERWFFGDFTNMAHQHTKIIVVGTVMHELDLLNHVLRMNPQYMWVKYKAVFDTEEEYEYYRSGRYLEDVYSQYAAQSKQLSKDALGTASCRASGVAGDAVGAL